MAHRLADRLGEISFFRSKIDPHNTCHCRDTSGFMAAESGTAPLLIARRRKWYMRHCQCEQVSHKALTLPAFMVRELNA
jgi:hypothetical protein